MFVRRVGYVPSSLRTALLAGAVVFGAARTSPAETGFALDRFDPSERGSHWFFADSLDIRGNQRFAFGIVGDFAHEPLVLRDSNGEVVAPVVSDQFFLHLGATLVLADRLRFGVNLPLLVYQNASAVQGPTGPVTPSEGATLGELRLATDLRVVGYGGDPITLGVGVRAYFPTGSRDAFTGDGVFSLLLRTQLAGQFEAFVYAAEAGMRIRGRDQDFGGEPIGSEIVFGGAVGAVGLDGRLVVGPEIWTSSVFSDGSEIFFARTSTPVEAILGAHLEVMKDVRLALGVGPGLSAGMGAPSMRYLFSLEWVPGVEPAERALPPIQVDRDGDGIQDGPDRCPEIPGPDSNDPEQRGCPLPIDSDADGIQDSDDACPTEAGAPSAEPTKHGCPTPADADRDGILDADDACRNEPGPSNLVERSRHGCPLPADTDGDGVPDSIDACPSVVGTANVNPKKNGCPKAVITATQIQIFDRIEFETGQATLRAESTDLLREIASILAAHPEVTKVSIEGHTDNRGGVDFNLALSRRRAAAVATWLTSNGIGASRLTSTGFGITRPIESNATDEGRQNNRRVEFQILERASK